MANKLILCQISSDFFFRYRSKLTQNHQECGRKDENEFAQTRQRQKKGLQDIHKGGGERSAAEIRG